MPEIPFPIGSQVPKGLWKDAREDLLRLIEAGRRRGSRGKTHASKKEARDEEDREQ